jgi:hypothetical protein
MSKARDRIVERRLHAPLASTPRPRRISVLWEGKVLSGIASTHKLRAGRLYNLRLRIWRRFHTVPLMTGD